MIVAFNDSTFYEDMDRLVAGCDKYDKPLVVLPVERDVAKANDRYMDMPHITFISFDYFLSRRWIVDDNYDHIDFFRLDKVLKNKTYGTPIGIVTFERTIRKREEEEEVNA